MKNTITDIISRRALLQGMGLGAAAGIVSSAGAMAQLSITAPSMTGSSLTFPDVLHGINQGIEVAKGYSAEVFLRWGDKIFADAPEFDPRNLSSAAQEKQFGYNCAFIAMMPLPMFSAATDTCLMCVTHESTVPSLIFPDDTERKSKMKKQELEDYESNKLAADMAAHGATVVEVKNTDGKWKPVLTSKYNRRITAQTKIRISGPAAGNDRMKASYNAAGDEVGGTIATSSGGVTPWGTILMCEKNIHEYFGGKVPASEQRNYSRNQIGSATNAHGWENLLTRFHMEKDPLEPNRFGWVVEFDPYDPASRPVKRTALGRFKHEGASVVTAKDGRVVVYMGDSGENEYIYKFISKNKLNYQDRNANLNLLDEGTLYVAKFNDDGTMKWLPLVQGQGKLTPENGFKSQGDVMIDARIAAELTGATPMDKPAEVKPNPVSGHVFALLSGNSGRGFQSKNAANPRTYNIAGHIIEMGPLTGDQADETFGWDFFILAGDPLGKNSKTIYGNNLGRDGWFACPTNCAFDKKGRIWISTGQESMQRVFQTGDGVYASDTSGSGSACSKHFFRAPAGAEVCSPCFAPDYKALFLSVQHPAEGSAYKDPSTRWPDFMERFPPRPSVVVTKDNNGVIGD
jgi:secreted PhoX family phosphatase